MKIKVTKEILDQVLSDPDAVLKSGIKMKDPWWVILLKVIAYAIGLVLGGAITTSCAQAAGLI